MLNLAQNLKKLKLGDSIKCFAFDLSIRVSEPIFEETYYERSTEIGENELVRIDWDSNNEVIHDSFTVGGGVIIDPQYKISAYLEFKESMKDSMVMLRGNSIVFFESLNDTK
jgi:hypothetical protein